MSTPLLRLSCKCVNEDSIQTERKYLHKSRLALEKVERLLNDEKKGSRLSALKEALANNLTFLKANEAHYKHLNADCEKHKEFYVDYARSFVQLSKQNSYNVQRGKKPLTEPKSAWQYGTNVPKTGKKRKRKTQSNKGPLLQKKAAVVTETLVTDTLVTEIKQEKGNKE